MLPLPSYIAQVLFVTSAAGPAATVSSVGNGISPAFAINNKAFPAIAEASSADATDTFNLADSVCSVMPVLIDPFQGTQRTLRISLDSWNSSNIEQHPETP